MIVYSRATNGVESWREVGFAKIVVRDARDCLIVAPNTEAPAIEFTRMYFDCYHVLHLLSDNNLVMRVVKKQKIFS